MNRTFIALAALIIASGSARAAGQTNSPPVVYYGGDRSVAPREESQALATYRRQYNVAAPGKNDRFTPPRVSTRAYPRTSPGGKLLPNGTVRFAAIVTADGRVTKPVVLNTADDYLGISVLGVLRAWRCRPALLNGAPVAALLIYDFEVRRPGPEQYPRDDTGLGQFNTGNR